MAQNLIGKKIQVLHHLPVRMCNYGSCAGSLELKNKCRNLSTIYQRLTMLTIAESLEPLIRAKARNLSVTDNSDNSLERA